MFLWKYQSLGAGWGNCFHVEDKTNFKRPLEGFLFALFLGNHYIVPWPGFASGLGLPGCTEHLKQKKQKENKKSYPQSPHEK